MTLLAVYRSGLILRVAFAAAALTLPLLSAGAAQAPTNRNVRNPDPSAVPSGTYVADPEHTRILWTVSHHGYSHFFAILPKVDATLVLDSANVANSKLTATVDMTALDPMVYPPSGEQRMMGVLRAPDMFNLDKYKTATFTSTKIERTGTQTATVTGDLTFLGVTKPATLHVTFLTAGEGPTPGYRVGFDATMKMNRLQWGMADLGPSISYEVTLTIEAEFNPVPKR